MLIFWTPPTPVEIAKELRPFMYGQSARPTLRGRLGSRGMSIQRYLPRDPEFPRLTADYERISEGTMLFATVESSAVYRAKFFTVDFLAVLALFTVALISADPW